MVRKREKESGKKTSNEDDWLLSLFLQEFEKCVITGVWEVCYYRSLRSVFLLYFRLQHELKQHRALLP